MRWFDVDGAREHLAYDGGKRPSRKVIYAMVDQGLRVARIGDTGRRMMFSAEWLDEFLCQRASTKTDVSTRAAGQVGR
jgi:hypothetical protein